MIFPPANAIAAAVIHVVGPHLLARGAVQLVQVPIFGPDDDAALIIDDGRSHNLSVGHKAPGVDHVRTHGASQHGHTGVSRISTPLLPQ